MQHMRKKHHAVGAPTFLRLAPPPSPLRFFCIFSNLKLITDDLKPPNRAAFFMLSPQLMYTQAVGTSERRNRSTL